METLVKNLYESTKAKYRLKIHCGRSGMKNSASWVYLAEDLQNGSFLKSGELIVTTGLFTRNGTTLYDFIRLLVLHRCSGLLINIGQYLYLEDITPEIAAFCDSSKFPLITFPGEAPLANIMQDFCMVFLRGKQREDDLNAAFQSAVCQKQPPEEALRTLNHCGFPTKAPYLVLAARGLEDDADAQARLNTPGRNRYLFRMEGLHVLVLGAVREETALSALIQELPSGDGTAFGVSDVVPSLTEIGTAYRHACFSLAVAQCRKQTLIRFEGLGVLQLLFSISDTALLQAYCRRYLGGLAEYDWDHGSDYLNTLRAYLLSDCSLLNTAEQLHTHRNTVVYRIRKIREMLGSELNDSEVKFNLMLAFYIKEYFSM